MRPLESGQPVNLCAYPSRGTKPAMLQHVQVWTIFARISPGIST